MAKRKENVFHYFSRNLLAVVGVVLIWRGLWHLMDSVDHLLFNGNPLFTAIGGIIVGLLILYLPDKDLSDIEKL